MTVAASVIVPTYNGERKIASCLDALLAQETQVQYEIIVVDDGSTDGTCSTVARYGDVRLVSQTNAGPAAARNRGAEAAEGDILLFIDDDCIPLPDWLDRMLSPFDDPDIMGAKGAYLSRQQSFTARFVQVEYEEKYDVLSRSRYIDFIDTYPAAFRRHVFLETGGFDQRFSTASTEDQEFSFRLANLGCRMVFIPAARVWHTHIDTIGGYVRKKYKIGYWKVLTLVRNPNKIAGDSHTPRTLQVQVLLMALIFLSPAGFLGGPAAGMLGMISLPAAFLLTTIPLTYRCFRHPGGRRWHRLPPFLSRSGPPDSLPGWSGEGLPI